MALSFPNSPTLNDIHSHGGKSWQWNGAMWVAINAGVQGPQGTQGTQGIQGIQGAQGTQGVQGIQGVQGTQGTQGIQGIQGAQGTQGIQGIQGITGAQGTLGAQGAVGAQGTQGIQGIQGIQGRQGITGSQGTQGQQGITGSAGTNGSNGAQGAVGSTGSTGSTGAQGAQGTSGATILGNNNAFTGANTFPSISVANSGAGHDPYGAIGVTMPSGANYSYYGLTRAGVVGCAIGIDTSSQMWFGTAGSGYSGTRTATWFYANSSGNLYAQAYYDSNDTGYYCNPNGTSNLSVVAGGRIYAGWDSGVGGSISTNAWFRSADASGWYNSSYGGGIWMSDSSYVRTYGSKIFLCDTSVRSPIFYDSDDTSYYLDPNSTSDTALRVRGGILHGPNPTWGAYLYVGTNGNMSGTATVAVTNGNIHIDTSSSSNPLYLQYYCGGYTALYGSARSPIFYDLYDTGYYCDPNSTSVLSRISTVRSDNWVYIDNHYGDSLVGAYNSTIFQGVFAMGDSYKLTQGGGVNNLYGMCWSHPNAGGAAGNLDSHGMIVLINGGFASCMSYSIKASSNVTAYSDERLKKDWSDLPKNYVEELAKVKVGTYTRIDGEKLRQVGVSAQSLRPLLPEAVIEAEDDFKTLSVAYGNAAMASAVELAKEVVSLKEQLAAVLERLNKLENK